jgi:membrane associated rhomboid family serine protease
MIPIPLNDDVRRRTFWGVTLALIVANTLVFLYELSLGPALNHSIRVYGLVPARYLTPYGWVSTHLEELPIRVIASMFLHGGWLHLIGNMLFLFVFGRSVEDRFGHQGFLLLYFASGFAAALLDIQMNAGSWLPTIGASGAIAGVLGAYLICFPVARITVGIFLIVFLWTVHLPAIIVLGYWFLIQFAMGFRMLTIQSATGGVAWWAHVGGFGAGILFGLWVRLTGGRSRTPWPVNRLT